MGVGGVRGRGCWAIGARQTGSHNNTGQSTQAGTQAAQSQQMQSAWSTVVRRNFVDHNQAQPSIPPAPPGVFAVKGAQPQSRLCGRQQPPAQCCREHLHVPPAYFRLALRRRRQRQVRAGKHETASCAARSGGEHDRPLWLVCSVVRVRPAGRWPPPQPRLRPRPVLSPRRGALAPSPSPAPLPPNLVVVAPRVVAAVANVVGVVPAGAGNGGSGRWELGSGGGVQPRARKDCASHCGLRQAAQVVLKHQQRSNAGDDPPHRSMKP